jgi:hypothetical protein
MQYLHGAKSVCQIFAQSFLIGQQPQLGGRINTPCGRL